MGFVPNACFDSVVLTLFLLSRHSRLRQQCRKDAMTCRSTKPYRLVFAVTKTIKVCSILTPEMPRLVKIPLTLCDIIALDYRTIARFNYEEYGIILM